MCLESFNRLLYVRHIRAKTSRGSNPLHVFRPSASEVLSLRMPLRRTLLRWSPATPLVIATVLLYSAVVAAHPQLTGPAALMRPADLGKLPMPPADHTLSYGQDANQIGELRLPAGSGPHPVIVLMHGGCWM